jgi:hypothetical protein
VIGLFDEIKTDHFIYSKRGLNINTEPTFPVILGTMEISGYSLLAIENDIASFYYFSAANYDGPHNVSLRLDESNGELVEFTGLWSNNAEAINLFYPENLVMEARITSDRTEFQNALPLWGGMVAHNAILLLKERNWRVGLVKGSDGYTNVEPLLPDGAPKNERWGAYVEKLF